jgi:UDP-N-acetylmuramoylalanine--D-glutamate ligase
MTPPPPPFTPFPGARIAVVGLGRAGLPAALRLRDWGAEVTAWDDDPARRAEAEAAGIVLRAPGAGRLAADALLLSPGIPHRLPKAHPAAVAAEAAGVPILCDAEFLYRAVLAAQSGARFVGVTGTNGKSTTTALIDHMLHAAGRSAEAGGNLGPAALGLNILGSDGVYTLEMSSYMLERIATLRFNVAVMLNISPDHLDRHGDMAGYAAAKANIFARQTAEDVAVLGQDDPVTRGMAPLIAARIVPVAAQAPQPGGIWAEGRMLRDESGAILDLDAARALPGAHNAQNAAAAAAAGFALGLSRAEVAQGLATYPGLPHRQEVVGTARGVAFVNDSKATNADSAARALASYGRVVWIAGGEAKAGGIESLEPFFPRIAKAFLIGRDAPAFAATLARHGVPHEVAGTLDAALPAAAAAAFAGAAPVVLLSPAAASFDQFAGFDARGDRFRDLARAIIDGGRA